MQPDRLRHGALALLLAATAVDAAEPADTVPAAGGIYTVNPAQPWAQAVAASSRLRLASTTTARSAAR